MISDGKVPFLVKIKDLFGTPKLSIGEKEYLLNLNISQKIFLHCRQSPLQWNLHQEKSHPLNCLIHK